MLGSGAYLHSVELIEEGKPTIRLGLVCGANVARFELARLISPKDTKIEVNFVEAERLK